MSSTSNAQNLLVNVFRPTYVYEAGVGYTPSLVMSNIDKVVSSSVVTSNLVINDPGSNTYIGSNAGNPGSNLRASSNNVAIGYNAGNQFSNTSNTIAVGYNALGGALSNVSNTVAIGANTIGGGVNNILIGHDTGTIGSNNILIGPNQTPGIISNQLRVGLGSKTVIAADLSSQYVGINNVAPITSFDVSGQAYFRNKVGIQVEAPSKSLEVNGQTYSSIGFLAGRGNVGNPAYAFYADEPTGFFSPSNGHGTLAANGQRYITFGGSVVDFHNQVLVNADISGSGIGNLITVSNGYYRNISGSTILSDISEGNIYTLGDIVYSGGISNTNTNTRNVIGGVVLSNGDVSANTYNGPGGTANAPHYTFSDDRTTGLFFPGANMIGLTAGGTERIRISNASVGIGTTAPGSALDVSGTMRVIGSAGNITFSNGVINAGIGINLSGTPIVASNGAFSNLSTTSNSIGGVTLSNTNLTLAGTITGSTTNTSNVIGGVVLSNTNISNAGTHTSSNFIGTAAASNSIGGVTLSNTNLTLAGTITGSTANTSNVIGGTTLSNTNISNTGTTTTSNILVGGYVRNALIPTQFDISGGNISNSATIQSSNFITGTASSNNIGGVILNASNITAGTGSNSIGGVTLNASNVITGSGSNSIGGVTLSNTNVTFSGTITGSTANTSNVIGGVTLSNNNVTFLGKITALDDAQSNYISGVTLSNATIVTGSSGSNSIGGVTLSNTNLSLAGTITGSTANRSNSIGGITLSNGTTTSTNILASGYIRNGINPTQFDISGGNLNIANNIKTSTINVATAGSATSASFYFFNQSNLGFYGVNNTEVAFVSSNGERLRFNEFGIYNAGTSSNTVGGVILTNTRVGIGVSPSFQIQLSADSAVKPTTNTWTISSDERIKQNIINADVNTCYSNVKKLKLKRFTWDVSYMPNVPDRNSVGWIAQDVIQVFPKAVTCVSNNWFLDFHMLDVDQIYKSMYGALEKVIEDKEALEARVLTLETQLADVLTRLSNANL